MWKWEQRPGGYANKLCCTICPVLLPLDKACSSSAKCGDAMLPMQDKWGALAYPSDERADPVQGPDPVWKGYAGYAEPNSTGCAGSKADVPIKFDELSGAKFPGHGPNRSILKSPAS